MPAASMAAGLPRAAGDRRGGAAAVGLIDTGEDLDQRRFTGAVLANQAMNLPRIEAQGNRIKRGDAGKTFTDLLQRPDQRRGVPPGC